MKTFVIFLVGIILAFSFLFFAILLYISTKAKQDTAVAADVILVLGGRAFSGRDCYGPICKKVGFIPKPHYNPCVVARVNHAVSLYNNHSAPIILMSGGTDREDNINEAETMKKIAVEAGVPESDILLEKESTSTYENFSFSQKILHTSGLNSVIIVSDPYHNARAGLVASKLGYTYSLSPVRDSPCSQHDTMIINRNFLKEAVALIVYKFLGKI